jgi:protein-L-isoaspartate(D-aspartate) O-methyltransferase
MKHGTQGIGMTSLRTRTRLVERLREEGIRDGRVLEAIGRIPRHLFVDEALSHRAYEDTALPIGLGQTISQPYVVALMSQAAVEHRPKKVLEVGTGSGYQTAVLASLVTEVYTIERLEPLMRQARRRLRELGYHNVHFRTADGSSGWPEHAPYDAIVVTAAASELPSVLVEQLSLGGRLIIPVGSALQQELLLVERTEQGVTTTPLEQVVFVPLVAGRT